MENLSAKELRIGNILHDRENRLCKVKEIKEEQFYAPAIKGGITGLPNNAIPLTKQWLIDFGFEDQKSGLYKEINYDDSSGVYLGIWAYKSLDLALTYSHDSFADWDDFYTDLDITYVHQLQNLYFALTGRELELKTKTL